MTRIKEVVECLHSVAPNHLQESYDNAGLLVGDENAECTGVITCLDSTEEVIEEAITKGCNLIVAHHPIVFRGLKRFTGSNYVQRTIIKAIKHDIAIFAIHTNLDNVLSNGVNQQIADRIGLINTAILSPKDPSEVTIGSGLIGELNVPAQCMDFLKHLKSSMQVGTVKYTKVLDRVIRKVAVCGGSGGFLLEEAVRQEADIFITSDYKYHEFFDADNRIVIADIGHFESEQFTTPLLQELISRNFSTFAAHCTTVVTNPVKYL